MDDGVKRIIDQALALDAQKQAESAARVDHGQVAGFWIRVGADILDAAVLFALGAVLSLPLRSVFEGLGERGVFVGLAISLVYSGVLHSRYGGGQTVGKRLLRLRVVRLDGTLISLDRALVRFALMGLLVYQGAVALALTGVLPFIPVGWAQALVTGLGAALFFGCVLVVPFHPLKRGLHDLLAGTIVIRRAMPDPAWVAARSRPRRERAIVAAAGALAVVAIGASVATSHLLSRSPEVTALSSVAEQLRATGVTNVGVSLDHVSRGGAPAVVTLRGTAFVPRPPGGGEPDWGTLAASFDRVMRAALPPGANVDRIGSVLRTGFNIGIYKSYETRVISTDAHTGQLVENETMLAW